jgi:hypothetical protein
MNTSDPIQTVPSVRELWEQQPGESELNFSLFRQYLDLGPGATLKEFADQTQRAFSAVRQLSSGHRWLERAAAWRQHLAQVHYAAAEQVVQDQAAFWAAQLRLVRQLEWENAQIINNAFQAAALEFLNKPDPKFPLYALPQLSEAASKLMRRAAEPASSLDGAARNRNADLALVEFQKMAGVVYAEKAAELAAREASANQINSSGNGADSALHPLPPVSTN